MKGLYYWICIFIFSFLSLPLHASGEKIISFNVSAHSLIKSPTENFIFATTQNDNSVAIIDMDSLVITDKIFVGSSPAGLAISEDGYTLYVALSGSNQIAIVDLSTKSLVDHIILPAPPYDIELGKGRLYVTPVNQNVNGIMQIDLSTQTVTSIFNDGVSVYRAGLLEIDSAKNVLYFANKGLSPATIAKYDVSTSIPSLIYKNPHGSLGSNGQDLFLSESGEFIYFAVGGGNRISNNYDIGQLTSDSFYALGSFATGAYPREITTSSDDLYAYAVHTSGHIDVWDAQTFLKIKEYSTVGEAKELIVDASGQYLLAAFDNELRIYTAEARISIDGDNDGVDDIADNCPGVYNSDQLDTDNDGQGDLCDLYPLDADHLGACLFDNDGKDTQISQLTTLINSLQSQLVDSDNDGVIDSSDLCPATPIATNVDQQGCSITNFCSRFIKKNTCRAADWENDEPSGSYDCKWLRNKAVCKVK